MIMSAGDAELVPVPEAAGSGMTRREWFWAAAASGVALAGTAMGAEKLGSFTAASQYEAELIKLRGLLTLYEQLERVGLDTALETGLRMVRTWMDGLAVSVRLLRFGVTTSNQALQGLQATVDDLHNALEGATQAVADLMQKFHDAESVVGGVVGSAQPLADSIQTFFNPFLDRMPFGLGDNVRHAVDSLATLVRAVPTTVESVTARLFKPLNDGLFAATGSTAAKTGLFDPISQNLLQPLDQFLGDVESMIGHWENDFAAPVESALEQRRQIRQQIVEYRKQNPL